MNVRTKLKNLKDAIQYAGKKGWSNVASEKSTEDIMEWCSLYKWLAEIRANTNSYAQDNNVDYRNELAILNRSLNTYLDKAKIMYIAYYSDVPTLPTLPNGEWEPEAYNNWMIKYKLKLDALLYNVGILYNRIKLMKKIMLDQGFDVPNIPPQTLRKLRDIFQSYPVSFFEIPE